MQCTPYERPLCRTRYHGATASYRSSLCKVSALCTLLLLYEPPGFGVQDAAETRPGSRQVGTWVGKRPRASETGPNAAGTRPDVDEIGTEFSERHAVAAEVVRRLCSASAPVRCAHACTHSRRAKGRRQVESGAIPSEASTKGAEPCARRAVPAISLADEHSLLPLGSLPLAPAYATTFVRLSAPPPALATALPIWRGPCIGKG